MSMTLVFTPVDNPVQFADAIILFSECL